MTGTHYKISAELLAHDQDVRVLTALPSVETCGPRIISGSRDRSVRLWTPESDPFHYTNSFQYEGHSHFVSALCYVPKDESTNGARLYTGCNDNVIRSYDLSIEQPVVELKGHTDTITALCHLSDGSIVSASWDSSIRIWSSSGESIANFQAHQFAVWDVIALPNGNIASCGADKLIKIWQGKTCIKTISGHSDVVRGLCLLDGIGFASCSNDGTVRTWTLDGEAVAVLHGHTSFVYAVCQLPSGMLASSGEDRCLRIWSGELCAQTIVHPCESVWCVAALDNGDIATGGSDGIGRVFTDSSVREGAPELRERFEREVKAQQIASQTMVGDLDKDSVPGPEALQEAGAREGVTKMIKQSNGKVECYQWSVVNGWQCLGEVVDAVGSGRKQVYNGKEYDYLFDVDIQDGVPPLKLPYNSNQNPYEAAQDFINDNELNQQYLDEIAQFIVKNASATTIGEGSVGGASDPFTGTGGYRPDGSAPSGSSNGSADPFTGTGAYTTGQANSIPTAKPSAYTGAGNVDPFTSSAPVVTFFPQQSYVTFAAGNSAGAVKKVTEFNQKDDLPETGRLNPAELAAIPNMVTKAGAGVDVSLHTRVVKKLLAWPECYIFPGVDVLRLVVLTEEGARMVATEGGIDVATRVLRQPNGAAPNLFLSGRLLANGFTHIETRGLVLRDIVAILESLNGLLAHDNRNVRLALATVLLNVSVGMTRKDIEPTTELVIQCLTLLGDIVLTEKDPEVLFRALVALGTYTSLSTSIRSIVSQLEFGKAVELISRSGGAEFSNVRKCADAVLKML